MTPDTIPEALHKREQWVIWRPICGDEDCDRRVELGESCPDHRDAKPTKVPFQPEAPDYRASKTNADHWSDFEAAVDIAHRDDVAGIGFIVTADDRFVGFDLDGCRDPETGVLADWARDIVDRADTYFEVSPSARGLRGFAFGFLPEGRRRRGGVELYDSTWYFTVTGDHLKETPATVEERGREIHAIHADYVSEDDPKPDRESSEPPGEVDLEDFELLERAKAAENGDRFERLWNGDTSMHDDDHSRARMALLNHLTFWTRGDAAAVDRLFRRSGLYPHPEKSGKWDRVGDDEIQKAISNTPDFYDPEARASVNGSAASTRADAGGGGSEGTSEPGGGGEPEDDGPPTWEQVKTLFDSDVNGTTTRAYAAASERIDNDYDFVTVRETGGVFYYAPDRGFWVRKGRTFIGELLERHIPDHLSEYRKRNIREKVADRNYIANADFEPPEGKLNVENGVLDLDTRQLENHSPTYYFTSQVRAEWPDGGKPDPWAEAWWLRALADATGLPAEREKVEQFVGYICEPWHHAREMNMIFVGPPLSGKSTIQEAIEALFGDPPTVSNLTPQQIADTQFDAARLREAALNTVNDINATKIEDTGTLKRVWSGERTKMENKYEDADFAASNAKHLFTANWVPRLVGQDESIYRRMLIVEFTKSIPDEQKDEEYKQRLKRPAIRQAVLVRALDARDRLNEQDGFTNDRPRDETRELYNSWRDAHRRYLYTQFELTMDPDDKVDREAYNIGLQEFCGRKGFAPVSRASVTKTLQYVPGVYAGGRDDTYGGLRWRDVDAGEPSEPERVSLSQFSRRANVREWIRELAEEEGADHDDVLARADEAGIDRERVEHDIEDMLEKGKIYEVGERRYRVT